MKKFLLTCTVFLALSQCDQKKETSIVESTEVPEVPFLWENANIYFLLTDRFNNGNPANDLNFERNESTAVLRGFEGGDILGITQKIKDGYFSDLGINAIWFTPVVEQVHGLVDEGTGATYGYHGYWAKDWTSLDPNFGTEDDLAELVRTAHANDIRIVFDIVINHTGPVTSADPVWPEGWVRTSPKCEYQSYETTVECTLVENLPDIRTDSDEEVELPASLKEKWESEGRLEQELSELDAFFERTGYPRAPRFYIMKWICDYVEKYGIDAFRVDTAKHTEASIWGELYKEAVYAFNSWKSKNPDKVLDENEFYMFGEVYNYNISSAREFDYGDKKVDFFDNGFGSLINFEFKYNCQQDYEHVFSKYDSILNSGLQGLTVVNYLTSHDDGDPFDKTREKPIEAGTKLLLAPGSSQVYYGDESIRNLIVEGSNGDATLRSFMNWDEIQNNSSRGGYQVQDILAHYQKLGKFRAKHPAVGAGRHQMISESPYLFTRTLNKNGYQDQVIVGLELNSGQKTIDVSQTFPNGVELVDYYSGISTTVEDGKVSLDSPFDLVLLGI